ncbi:MAG TPA: hypothetical protein VNY52_08160 [Solirubrobacteraceae bacterium]|nr:hypothetical protein [Solirubrobacteraceae bacterium]
MKITKAAMLALVAVFAFSVVVVAQATAAEYVYHVEKKELAKGETREIKSSVKKEFVLRGKGIFNIESVTKCKALELNAAEKPVIVGGKPGKSEKEKIEFKECSATVGGAKCEKVEVENVSTSNEIVTVVKPEKLKGRLATLFTPAGEVFSKVKFIKCGALGNQKAEVKGKSAGLDEPNGLEEVKDWLVYATGEAEITEVERSNGEKVKVELTNEGKKATIEGEAWVELVKGEKWGVF